MRRRSISLPETPLFHKGATLYNIAAARVAAHNAGKSTQSAQNNLSAQVIAVEGYVDVIAMVNAGFEATVARSAPRSPPTSSCCCGRWRTS
jgi:DNA primase